MSIKKLGSMAVLAGLLASYAAPAFASLNVCHRTSSGTFLCVNYEDDFSVREIPVSQSSICDRIIG